MRVAKIKYGILLPFLFCVVFTSLSTAKTPTKTPIQDTLIHIKKLQLDAQKAIETQNFIQAVQYLNTAHKLTMVPAFKNYKPDIELSIAELYYNLQYFDKAETETQKVIAVLEEFHNDLKLTKAYNLYGLVEISKENYSISEEYLSKSDSVFEKTQGNSYNVQTDFARGQLEMGRAKYEAAIDHFKKTIPEFKKQKMDYWEAYAYNNVADAFSLLAAKSNEANAILQAREALRTSTQIARANGFVKLLVEGHRIQSQISMVDGNAETAENELQMYLHQKDSLRQLSLTALEKGIQAESDIGDLNEIIASQQDDLSKQEKSLFFGKLTGWLSIALILILSLLTLSLYKNNNLRAKANELLQDKNTELQQAKEKAEKASQAKAQFLSTITHELRTPMYTVTGLTHLLLEEDPKPEQREHLNSLKFSGEYLLSLINNILDLNKLEANKVEIEKAPFNLKKRAEGVLIALKKSAETKKNQLHFEYDDSLPIEILGDSLKISQILINLISNSIKFTEEGDIWVRINAREKTSKRVMVHFEVEDTGDGISKKKQNSIFESFSQGSLQINRKYGGTGLGLSIVKNLLELMGSKIYLESSLGKGSKFWFAIAYDIPESEAEDARNKNLKKVIDNGILTDKSILIVEDNKINQMITKKILEKKNMVCSVTDNGTDAIKMTKEKQYDVILMDIHMPGISGIEATKKIREFNKEVPIIALTAVTIEENLEDFYKAGFNEFIPKPFNAEDFFEKINRVLTGNDFLHQTKV